MPPHSGLAPHAPRARAGRTCHAGRDARALGVQPRAGPVRGGARAARNRCARARQADEMPDTLLLLEHPPVYTRGRRSSPTSCRRAAVSRSGGDRGGRRRPRRPRHLPRPRPARRLPDREDRRRDRLPARAGARDRRGASREGLAAPGAGERPTGVWVAGRKIASIGVHVSRRVTTHGFAVNADNDLAPFSWIVPCGMPDVQMTSVALETGRARHDRRPARRGRDRARARARAHAPSRRAGAGAPRAGRLIADARDDDALEVQPRRHGRPPRARHRHRRAALAQAAVVQGAGAGRPALPRADGADRGRQPAHGLPGGGLPQRRRVLGARHRDVHDPRRHLHAPLRLLQREDRQADVERPARAGARRALGRAHGPAPRGHHLASTATTSRTSAAARSRR